MGNPPFEDVFPIQDGDFPLLCLFTGGYFDSFPPLVKNYNNPKESMQLDIFFTYYLKTHRIVLAQNGRKKKTHQFPWIRWWWWEMEDFSHFFFGTNGPSYMSPRKWIQWEWNIISFDNLQGNDLRDDVLTLLSKPNVMSVVVGAFASGRHYLRIYGSGAGVVGPTWSPDLTGSSQGCDVNLSWQDACHSLNEGLKRRPGIFELKVWYFDMSARWSTFS